MPAINGPSGNRPTIRTVADRAGVSRQTVSNVLNFPERVSPELRKRVLAAAADLGYRPNANARSLALRSTGLLAFRVGDGRHNEVSILDPFMRELARIGRDFGYRVVLDYAPADDAAQIATYEDLHARQLVDGVVIAETHRGDRRPDWLLDHGMACVAFGRPWGRSEARHSWVDVDMSLGMELAVAHLAERGHCRIGYSGPPPDGARSDARWLGWVQAMSRLNQDEDLAALARRADEAAMPEAIADLIDRAAPTAIACHDDGHADQAMHGARAKGLEPGRDIAIVGFDDSQLARHSNPPISSVAQPISEAASLVWRALADQFAHRDVAPLQMIVAPRLVVRESSDYWIGPARA
jgi:DNA-binding LacI/PurR family transcriptional regulator